MKNFLLAIAAMAMTTSVFADTQVAYSWESPEGTVAEQGGTIAYVNGDGDRLNYLQGPYYTVCLNGKKGNLNDEEASANAGHMVITLDEALKEGDQITFTAFRNKNAEGKKSSVYMLFENGTEFAGVEGGLYWTNICADDTNADYDNDGDTPNSYTWTVPAAEAGTKTITLTRNDGGTNLFVSKIEITTEAEAAAAPVLQSCYPQANTKVTEIPDNIILMFDQEITAVEAAAIQSGYNDPIMIENVQILDGNSVYLNVADVKSQIEPGYVTVYCMLPGVEIPYEYTFTLGKEFAIESAEFTAEGGQLIFSENVDFVPGAETTCVVVDAAGAETAATLSLDDDNFAAINVEFAAPLAGGEYVLTIPAATIMSVSEEEFAGEAIAFTVEGTVAIRQIATANAKVQYNLFGQRTNATTGIVISNGKKELR